MHRSRPTLVLAAVSLTALALTSCANELRSASPSESLSANESPSASASTQSHSSETTPVTVTPSPTRSQPYIPTPDLTDDFEADMVRYWPAWADLKPHVAQEIIDDICWSSMDNGFNSFYAVDEALALSSFHREVRWLSDYSEEDWMIPQVIVAHQCPERTKHVEVVVRFEYVQAQERAAEESGESAGAED